MKLVQELIEYFYHRGQLDNSDLLFLKQEGFHALDTDPEHLSDANNNDEYLHINENEAYTPPLSIVDIEEQKAADEISLTRKGKGKRSRMSEKKWSFEQFNNELLPQIEALDTLFSPLYRLVAKGNKAEIRDKLTTPYSIDEDYIKDTLERVLLYHYGQESALARAILTTDYLETFFLLSKKLSPKNRDRVCDWILGKKAIVYEPYHKAIFWARQMFDLQIRVLKIWRDLTPSVLNHHHKMGYGMPFLAKSSEQEADSLAAQLLMSFIFLHNFDNPTQPETTLILLLEKEGMTNAYKTMSAFFPKEIHNLRLRVNNESAFDVPFWLHKLNERYQNSLFLETHLWAFQVQKQSLSWTFLNSQNQDKIVLDDAICDKTWFKWHDKGDFNTMASGVFCTQYDEVGVFSEGMAAVRKGELWGFLDIRGILVIPCLYLPLVADELKFTEGYVACVRAIDNKHLYLDKYGKEAFPALEKHLGSPIRYASPFSEGYACVATTAHYWQIIDHLGCPLLDEKTASGLSLQSKFSEKRAVFKSITDELGFITPFGEKLSIKNTASETYNYLCPLRQNRAAIRNNRGLWGFVDTECWLVIPCIYDWVWSFSDGRSAVCREGLWGFIDLDGREIIPPQYPITEHFSNGYGGFLNDLGERCFVDINNQIISNNYTRTHVFSEGQAITYKDWRMYLLNTNKNENFSHNFNSFNLTDGYFVSLDPASGLKIMRKNQKTLCYIPDIQSVHCFAKDFSDFESGRVEMFKNRGFNHKPYTLVKNWCLSEGFMGVQIEKTNKWSFAFFEDDLQPPDPKMATPLRVLYIQEELVLVDEKQKIGIKIPYSPKNYVGYEFKSGNRILIKMDDEAFIWRYDLIFEKLK